jgi:regulator of protease activity HflC (stomatin/prohibitin superfamily)
MSPIIFIFAILAIWFLSSGIFIVRGKTAAILETFGKPHRLARGAGLQFKFPAPITTIVARVNLQLQEIEANVSVKTKDNAFMTLPVKVQYRVNDDLNGAIKAHYELEHPEQQIASYVLNNVRQTASGMEMVELYANRDSMEDQVRSALLERFAQFGYLIENVLVDEPQPSAEVREAFNRVIASHRLKEAAENEAAAARIRLVGVAEAEAKSKALQGEGMAQMREAVARGLETAMKTMTDAGLTSQEAMKFLTDTNRFDTISNAATHGNTIIIDMKDGGAMGETVAAVKAAMKVVKE